MNTIAKSHLSPGRRHLVELMQRINFGRIEGLPIRHGEPVLDDTTPPRVIHELKFSAENDPRPEIVMRDYALKQQVIDLFTQLDRFGDARIEVLIIKHGLPFGMHVEPMA